MSNTAPETTHEEYSKLKSYRNLQIQMEEGEGKKNIPYKDVLIASVRFPLEVRQALNHLCPKIQEGPQKGKIDVNQPGVRLLFYYLYYLSQSDSNLTAFTEVYESRFNESPVQTSLEIPSSNDIVEAIRACYTAPSLPVVIKLRDLITEIELVCQKYNLTLPPIMVDVKSKLDQVVQSLPEFNQSKEQQARIEELNSKIEQAKIHYRETLALSLSAKKTKKTKKADIAQFENLAAEEKRTLDALSQELETIRSQLIGDTAKQNLEQAVARLQSINIAQLKEELRIFNETIEKKRKAASTRISGHVDCASVVYLCIQREYEKLEFSGDELDKETVKAFCAFAVGITHVHFNGVKTGKIRHALAYEKRRKSANEVLKNFPFLKGISIKDGVKKIAEHLDKDPAVPTEAIIDLIAYLRFEAIEARDKHPSLGGLVQHGIGSQDLYDLEIFIRNLENIVRQRLANEILEGDKTDLWKKATRIVNENFYEVLEHARDDMKNDMEGIKEHLTHVEGGAGHHEDHEKTPLKILRDVADGVIKAIGRFSRGEKIIGATKLESGASGEKTSEHEPKPH